MKRWICGLALAGLLWTGSAPAQSPLDYRLKPRELAPGVYVIEGAVEDFSTANGCNIINTGFIVTGAGIVVINTGPSWLYGRQQREAIRRVSSEPVVQVLNLNLHPDYYFGNQAYADVPLKALPGTLKGMKLEGPPFLDNLYRLCGDWMKATEFVPATSPVSAGELRIGSRELKLMRLSGHTGDDLVVLDKTSGVMFAGGLVFFDRTPTTPHARIGEWLAALGTLETLPFRVMVPSHGHVVSDRRGIEQTRDYLLWLDGLLEKSARDGLDLNEVLATPIPERFRRLAAIEAEFVRNVTHLYAAYEQRILAGR